MKPARATPGSIRRAKNSLLGAKKSLLGLDKFPARRRREFAPSMRFCRMNCAGAQRARPRNLEIPC
jgi:hypothetical protein